MYEVIQVEWEPNYQDEIKEIYRMFKDQERRIFDLTNYEDGISVMDLIEKIVREDTVFLVKENDIPCATFVLTSPRRLNDIITRVNIHTAIRKPFWGKKAREISRYFLEYVLSNYPIHKIMAEVPQCGYGVIKLLKDLNFKHEGTLKESCVYKDKNGKPKYYDELIYSLTRRDI